MKGIHKRLVAFVLSFITIFALLPQLPGGEIHAASTPPIYRWMCWDTQGHNYNYKSEKAAAYDNKNKEVTNPNGKTIKNGCLVVACDKLLIQSGIKTKSFTPNSMYTYFKNYKGVSFSDANALKGDWVSALAATSSKLSHEGKYNIRSFSTADKKKFLMSLAKHGYQVLVQVKNPNYDGSQHWVYLYNEMSVAKGVPYIMDSVNSANEASFRMKKNVRALDAVYNGSSHYKYSSVTIIQVFKLTDVTQQKTFTVKYLPNEGSGTMANTTVTYGTPTTLRKNTFTREGYTFDGWRAHKTMQNQWLYVNSKGEYKWFSNTTAAKKEGYTKYGIYKDKSSISGTTRLDGDTVEMVAVWKKNASTEPSEPTPTEPTTPLTSTATISNAISPSGTLAKGGAFTISGTVKASHTISNVTVSVTNSSGSTMFKGSASPSKTSYSLYSLDGKMTFSQLAAGTYTYKVTVTETDGSQSVTKTLVNKTFKVAAASISATGLTVPSTLTQGKAFSVKGTVKANKIQKIEMSVKTTAGVTKFSASVSPNAASYDLHKQDAKMTFSKLPTGTYIYRVAVTDTNGITKYVVTKKFTVQ